MLTCKFSRIEHYFSKASQSTLIYFHSILVMPTSSLNLFNRAILLISFVFAPIQPNKVYLVIRSQFYFRGLSQDTWCSLLTFFTSITLYSGERMNDLRWLRQTSKLDLLASSLSLNCYTSPTLYHPALCIPFHPKTQ